MSEELLNARPDNGYHLGNINKRHVLVYKETGFYDYSELKVMIGLDPTTIRRMVKAGTFPKPVFIRHRRKGFKAETINGIVKDIGNGVPLTERKY